MYSLKSWAFPWNNKLPLQTELRFFYHSSQAPKLTSKIIVSRTVECYQRVKIQVNLLSRFLTSEVEKCECLSTSKFWETKQELPSLTATNITKALTSGLGRPEASWGREHMELLRDRPDAVCEDKLTVHFVLARWVSRKTDFASCVHAVSLSSIGDWSNPTLQQTLSRSLAYPRCPRKWLPSAERSSTILKETELQTVTLLIWGFRWKPRGVLYARLRDNLQSKAGRLSQNRSAWNVRRRNISIRKP